ncbi:MAG: aminoacyl-tRNA hydrolase [Chlamydiae bacterium]|nr:aminoacyl-tRNA hydrolase [Chlamydiota bacterium]
MLENLQGGPYLIAGLGNPGKSYERTRHNIGFVIVKELARKHGLEFRRHAQFKSSLAEGKIGSKRVILQMPLTYMNLSGEAVALAARFWKIDLAHLLVIVDDGAIPLGELRVKINSGSGGHNGLKSIEEHLQTQRYARLRVGVGDRLQGDLTSHVLGRFSEDEEKVALKVVERAVETTEIWLNQGMTSAMNFANPKHLEL